MLLLQPPILLLVSVRRVSHTLRLVIFWANFVISTKIYLLILNSGWSQFTGHMFRLIPRTPTRLCFTEKNWVHSTLGTSRILGYVYSKFQVGWLSKNMLLNFEISQSNSPKARLQRSLIGRLESTKLDRQNLQF